MRIREAARLRILGAAVIFSTGGALIKSTSFTGWQTAGLRSAVAAAAILALEPESRRRWSWRAPLVGVAYAGTLVLFVAANKLTTAASTIFLQSTAPLYLLVLGPLLLKEPLRRGDLVFMAAMGSGMALLLAGAGVPSPSAPDPGRGNLLALASGGTWALTLLGLRWMGRSGEGAASATVAGNIIAALVCAPWALPLPSVPAADWLRIAFLGIVQIGFAYSLLSRGLREISALESSLLILLEPVLNPLWAWAAQGETIGPLTGAGAAVILLATAMHVAAAPLRNAARGAGSPGPCSS